jgi:hypothetical protein
MWKIERMNLLAYGGLTRLREFFLFFCLASLVVSCSTSNSDAAKSDAINHEQTYSFRYQSGNHPNGSITLFYGDDGLKVLFSDLEGVIEFEELHSHSIVKIEELSVIFSYPKGELTLGRTWFVDGCYFSIQKSGKRILLIDKGKYQEDMILSIVSTCDNKSRDSFVLFSKNRGMMAFSISDLSSDKDGEFHASDFYFLTGNNYGFPGAGLP